jgi:hypothetical protein
LPLEVGEASQCFRFTVSVTYSAPAHQRLKELLFCFWQLSEP